MSRISLHSAGHHHLPPSPERFHLPRLELSFYSSGRPSTSRLGSADVPLGYSLAAIIGRLRGISQAGPSLGTGFSTVAAGGPRGQGRLTRRGEVPLGHIDCDKQKLLERHSDTPPHPPPRAGENSPCGGCPPCTQRQRRARHQRRELRSPARWVNNPVPWSSRPSQPTFCAEFLPE